MVQTFQKTLYFKRNIHKYIETGTQGNLNAKLLKSFEILLPSLKEQEKIANFLTSVDNKIELLERKYQSYVDFKKYLMQQIFAQKLIKI
jgi:type I restriction enzyme S subunit